jgi:hypothetical protein
MSITPISKDELMQMSDQLAQLIQKNPCAKCRAVKLPVCRCRVEMAAAEMEEFQENLQHFLQRQALLEDAELYASLYETSEDSAAPQPEKRVDSQEISDLLSNNILTIDSNSALGILTLRLLFNPGLLGLNAGLALKRYLDTLLEELEEFKKQHGISANCVTYQKDTSGNILSFRIHLPSSTLYDTFISQLMGKSLLPNQVHTPQNRTPYASGVDHFRPLNQLAPRLSPMNQRNTRFEEEEEEEKRKERMRLAARIRPRSPLDGLKPK